MKTCKIENCNNPVFSDGYCQNHRPRCKYPGCTKYARDKYEGYCQEHFGYVIGEINESRREYEETLARLDSEFLSSQTNNDKKMDSDTKKERSFTRDEEIKPEHDPSVYGYPDWLNKGYLSDAHKRFSESYLKYIEKLNDKMRKKINPYSSKKLSKKQEIAKIKKQFIKDFGSISMLSGQAYLQSGLDAFHIFPISKFPEYETEPWNIILSSREENRTWDQGTWEEIKHLKGLQMLLKIIWDKDHDPNKKHSGSFYHQLMERRNK